MHKAIIIGAGPAGYTAAIRLKQLGAEKVVLIERDLVGGICVNWGCTPSKAMISSAKLAKSLSNASEFGVNTSAPTIDFKQVAARRDKVMQEAREHIKDLLNHWGVELVQGEGEITSPNHVRVGDHTFETENIILATGSEPMIPPSLQKEDPSIVSSNRLISITDLPQELTIVGGGIIGLEIATIFSNLGTKVRVVELLDRCLAVADPEISALLTEKLLAAGVEILTGHKVLDINNGVLKLETSDGQHKEISSPLNLIAIGRRAAIDEDKMSMMGVATDKEGIIINDYLQTSVSNIYAIGDATGRSILAHVAIQQGIIAAENIMGRLRKMQYEVIPGVVYTLPEVGIVGTIPADITNVLVVKYPFTANLRASIEGHTDGFAKLWIGKYSRKLLGAQVIGDMAGEVIQGYANVIATDISIAEIANIIHAHPTYSEIVRNSFEYALDRAIEHY